MKLKRVRHLVITLSEEEAALLKGLLNTSHVLKNGGHTGSAVEDLSQDLWERLDGLDVKDNDGL